MHFSTLLLSASAAMVAAAPALEPRTSDYTINYDDVDILLLPEAPPTPYHGLNYNGFQIQGSTANVAPGNLQPKSPPNTLIFSTLSQTETGGDLATISKSSGHFGLKSTYFGCSVDAGAARVPTACQVVATGIDKYGKQQTSSLAFNPKGTAMQKFTFPSSFWYLKTVSFEFTGSLTQATAAQFDNVVFSTCDS